MPAIVRTATPADVEAILDLLTEYDLPRAYFEPWYRADPTYRPEHSWVVEVDGRLAAHLRIFDRFVRLHGTVARIAGIGNVITARAFRGQGFAGRLLRATIDDAADFVYSLLWTHLPDLYQRYGWASIDQQNIQARLPGPAPALDLESGNVDSFRTEDLPDVMRLYDAANATRTGPIVRTSAYWTAQSAWLSETADDFLVSRTRAGSLVAYVRSKSRSDRVEVLELGVLPRDVDLGRSLVAALAARRHSNVWAQLPPSLDEVIPKAARCGAEQAGLMGRVLDVRGLFRQLEPVLLQRLRGASSIGGRLSLSSSAGSAQLALTETDLIVHTTTTPDPRASLNEGELAHLLFHGYDAAAAERFHGRENAPLLETLFPAQDFVIWPADAF
jgi:predicted N-acetyltransferase YhbS